MLIAQLPMYAGYEEESVRYHGLSSTDGTCDEAQQYIVYKVTALLDNIDVLFAKQ